MQFALYFVSSSSFAYRESVDRSLARLELSAESVLLESLPETLDGATPDFALLVLGSEFFSSEESLRKGSLQSLGDAVVSLGWVNRLTVFIPKAERLKLDLHSSRFLKRHIRQAEFSDGEDLALRIEEEAKYWMTVLWQSASVKRHYFSISAIDRPGILLEVNKSIELAGGTVSLMQQYVYDFKATVFVTALFLTEAGGEKVRALLQAQLGPDSRVEIVDPQHDSLLVTSRVVFNVQLFPRAGVIEGVFDIFAEERMSIAECDYTADHPPVSPANLRIVLNSSESEDSHLRKILSALRSKAGVQSAEFSETKGTWHS